MRAQVEPRLIPIPHLAAEADEELARFDHLDLRRDVDDQLARAEIVRALAVQLDAERVPLLRLLFHEHPVLPAVGGLRGYDSRERGAEHDRSVRLLHAQVEYECVLVISETVANHAGIRCADIPRGL